MESQDYGDLHKLRIMRAFISWRFEKFCRKKEGREAGREVGRVVVSLAGTDPRP